MFPLIHFTTRCVFGGFGLPIRVGCAQQRCVYRPDFVKRSTQQQHCRSIITYQKDGTMENLHEIEELTAVGAGGVGHKYFNSRNLLRAVTAFADRPWWTARDEDNRHVGHVILTHVGDKHTTGSQLYILPEYRGSQVGVELFSLAVKEMYSESPNTSFLSSAFPTGEKLSRKIFHRMICDYNLIVKMKEISYDPCSDLLKKEGKGFYIEKLKAEIQFQKVVKFDTAIIHKVPRPKFLKHLLDVNTVDTYLAIDDSSGDVVGYGAIQPSLQPDCLILGPLYAINTDQASVLLHHLLMYVKPGTKLVITHTDQNAFMEDFTTAIMGTDVVATLKHFYTGNYSVPFRHENFFCWAGSTIVFC